MDANSNAQSYCVTVIEAKMMAPKFRSLVSNFQSTNNNLTSWMERSYNQWMYMLKLLSELSSKNVLKNVYLLSYVVILTISDFRVASIIGS